MKTLGILALLLSVALGSFHVVGVRTGYTLIPKASFTFADTFVHVGDVIQRYNDRSFAEALRGDPQLDNLVRKLEEQGYISPSKKLDAESKSGTALSSTPMAPQPTQVAAEPTSATAKGSTSTVPQVTQPLREADVSKYVGRHPEEVFWELAVEKKFKALLGKKYDTFRKNLWVGESIKLEGNLYTGSGCAAHACDSDGAAFAINRETGEGFAILFSDGKQFEFFGVTQKQKLPTSLADWYRMRGGE